VQNGEAISICFGHFGEEERGRTRNCKVIAPKHISVCLSGSPPNKKEEEQTRTRSVPKEEEEIQKLLKIKILL
jgi:hypothetical protein